MTVYKRIKGSLKYKLIIFFILTSIIPITITGIIVYNKASSIFVTKVTQSSRNMIMEKMRSADNYFKEINDILSEATSSIDTLNFIKEVDDSGSETKDRSEIIDRMAAQMDYIISLKPEIVNSIMILPTGKDKYPISRGRYNFITGFTGDYRNSDVFKRTLSNKSNLLWTFSYNESAGKYLVTASSRILNHSGDEVLGIVIIFLNMDQIEQNFYNATPINGEKIFVIDQNDSIIYSPQLSVIGRKFDNTAILNKIGKSSEGSFELKSDGEIDVVNLHTSLESGWRIISIVPRSNIISDVKSIPIYTLWIAFFCLIFAFIIAYFSYVNLYGPIRKLSQSMEKLSEGNLDIFVSNNRTDEIGLLTTSFNYMADQIKKLVVNIKKEQKQKVENEIKALQSQITPHFLYNTLNAIKTMVNIGRGDEANNMIIALINLLKTCANNADNFVDLQEELNYIKSYILIMEYRYDKNLAVTYDIDFSLMECKVLKFVIQPIVENCIIHAYEDPTQEKIIKIRIYRNSDSLEIIVKDNGKGMDEEEIKKFLYDGDRYSNRRSKNIGLKNINERIKLNYGENYGLKISSALGEGTSVLISLPYIDSINSDEQI